MSEKEFAELIIKSKKLGPSAEYVLSGGKPCIRVNIGGDGKSTTTYLTIVKSGSGFKLDNKVAYNNRNNYDSKNALDLVDYLNSDLIPWVNENVNLITPLLKLTNTSQEYKVRHANDLNIVEIVNDVLALRRYQEEKNKLKQLAAYKALKALKNSTQKTSTAVNSEETSLLLKSSKLQNQEVQPSILSQQPWNWTWDGDDEVEVGNLKFTGLKGLQLNDPQSEQLKAALGGLGYNTDDLSGSLRQYLQNKKNSLSYTSSLNPQESKPIEDYYDDRLKGGLLNLYSYISGNLNRGATWRLGKNDYNDIINSDWYNLLDDDSKEYFTRDKLNNQLGDRYFRSYLIGMNNNLNHEEN